MIATVLGLLLVACPGPFATLESKGDQPSEKMVAREVHYSGEVQGVGFRARAERIARDYPVTGWVKNLADGRVQLVVEGPEKAVTKFLTAIRTHWKKNIEKEKIVERKPTGTYRGFTIRR